MEYFHTLTLKMPLIIKANAKYHINISCIIISSYQYQAWDPEGWDCKSYDHITTYGYYECFAGNRLQEVALLSHHKYQLAFLRRSVFQRQLYAVLCRMLVSSEAQMSHLGIRVAERFCYNQHAQQYHQPLPALLCPNTRFFWQIQCYQFLYLWWRNRSKTVAGQFQKYHMK